MNEFAQILIAKKYGISDEGYFQPLKKNQEITFLAMAAEYDEMAEVMNIYIYIIRFFPTQF